MLFDDGGDNRFCWSGLMDLIIKIFHIWRRSLLRCLLSLVTLLPLGSFCTTIPSMMDIHIFPNAHFPIIIELLMDFSPLRLNPIWSKIFLTRSPYGNYEIYFLFLSIMLQITMLAQFVSIFFANTQVKARYILGYDANELPMHIYIAVLIKYIDPT